MDSGVSGLDKNVTITGYALCTLYRVFRMTLLDVVFVIASCAGFMLYFVIYVFNCGCVGHDHRRGGSDTYRPQSVMLESDESLVFRALWA